MEKIINQILDLPQMLNQKLPKNSFNEMMDNSEGSVSDWTGKIFKVGQKINLSQAPYGAKCPFTGIALSQAHYPDYCATSHVEDAN